MPSVPHTDPAALWALSPHEFNAWRANNDLPLLMAYFSQKLPGFPAWMDAYKLSVQTLCAVTPTSELFVGKGKKILVESRSDDQKHRTLTCSDLDAQQMIDYWKLRNKSVSVIGSFEPYLAWARRTLGRDRFFYANEPNKQVTDSFLYNMWSASDVPHLSRATLLSEFQVLKLGGIEVCHRMHIAPRNLDFVDLDHLVVSGGGHAPQWTSIAFSSCQHWTVRHAELHFIRFYESSVEDFRCEHARLQDICFESSHLGDIRFSDTYAFRLTFDKCAMRPSFHQCDLLGLQYVPPPGNAYPAVAEVYRRLRTVHQERGQRIEAAEAYYKERVFERKALFSPYLSHRESFPRMGYAGRLADIKKHWERRHFSTKESFSYALRLLAFHILKWIHPKYLPVTAKFKLRWLASLIEWLVWGYGERPIRIIGATAAMVLAYSAAFYQGIDELESSSGAALEYWDCLYLSMITFSTLGYDEVTPITRGMQLLCASEAVLGVFVMGLVVAGFANRSRY